MRNSKLLILGLIALLLVGGLVLASCKFGCQNDCGVTSYDYAYVSDQCKTDSCAVKGYGLFIKCDC
jgi:hypothetical protein